jgi:2-(1,2-epoxy-1,2-dihydrophenyl)acetyl-CoA isomerase
MEEIMNQVLENFADGIFSITLNRPERKNAMNRDLLEELLQALKNADRAKPQIVVIRGAGKAFCSGGDIVDFRNAEDREALIDEEAGVLHESIKMVRNIEAIVIAVIQGVAVGAGVGLSLACDLSIATRKTIMNMGYRRIGLTPDGGGSILLARLAGMKRFNEFYLLSRNIDMEEARTLGLVNFVVEEDQLEATLDKLAKDLMALPMETIGRLKTLVNNALWAGLETHLDKEKRYVADLGGKPLFKQRLDEFFTKK